VNKEERNDVLTVLKKIDTSINMFEQYRSTPYNDGMLASLRECKNEVLSYARGDITKEQMSYAALFWFDTMPSWGYAGT
jgi:hypothetical protein